MIIDALNMLPTLFLMGGCSLIVCISTTLGAKYFVVKMFRSSFINYISLLMTAMADINNPIILYFYS